MFGMLFDASSILPELDRSEREAAALVQGITDEQINFQPDDGRSWSIAQCLDHLSRINGIYATAMRAAIAEAPRRHGKATQQIRPGWFARLFIRSMDAPADAARPGRKFPAPAKAVPAPRKSKNLALSEFVSSHESIRRLLDENGGIDLNRVRFKNPFVRGLRFTVGTGILVILAHDRRHLAQAQRVRRIVLSQP